MCESGGFVVYNFDSQIIFIDFKGNDFICYRDIILSDSNAVSQCTLSDCVSVSVHIIVV